MREIVRLARLAERHGFDQFWLSHDLFLRSAPVALSQVAARTRRIAFGVGIMNPYTVHPAEIAMTAATLDELAPGRFRLGVAAGASEFLDWIGLAQHRPVETVRRAVRTLRFLLGHRDVPAPDGLRPEARLRIPPDAPIPVYMGAMGPRMIRLAGEEADGALPLLFPPERFFPVREILRPALSARGAEPARGFDYAACVWVSLARSAAAARRVLARKVAYYAPAISPPMLAELGVEPDALKDVRAALASGGPALAARRVPEALLRIGIAGDVDDVVERLAPIAAAGAGHVSFGPPLGGSGAGRAEAIRLLGKNVLPRLREVAGG